MSEVAEAGLHGDTHVHGRPLSGAVRRRVAGIVAEVTDGGRLARVSRLTGGLWAHAHAVDVELRDGARCALVLRRYVRWRPSEGADASCRRHAVALAALAGADVPVARLLWSDPDGAVLDVPALLTSRLPGRASLPLAATPRGVEQLAGALAAIHRLPPPDELVHPDTFSDWAEAALRERIPAWLADCPDADAVVAALRAGAAAARAPGGLAHGDFHAGNVLWSGTGGSLHLTGVVDWDVADVAPRGADVGYCRADLAMAFGQEVCDAFGAAYRRCAGGVPDAAWWDLLGAAMCWSEFREWVPAYRVFGVVDLTAEVMRDRLVAFTRNALRRAGG